MDGLPSTPVSIENRNGTMHDHNRHSESLRDMEESPSALGIEKKPLEDEDHIESTDVTDYSLFSNPPNLGATRQMLFHLNDQVEMSENDFEVYFQFVDNVWRREPKENTQTNGNEVEEIYWCRLRKAGNAKRYVSKPTPEGKISRRKRVREDKTCPMTMRVIHRRGGTKMCTFIRDVGPGVQHTHDLDYIDSTKRNSGIMDVARREAVRGFLPGSIFAKLHDEPDKLEAAGGKYLKLSDVRNVQYAWRQQNPTVTLKSHTGYSQVRIGPRPKVPGLQPSSPLAQSSPPSRLAGVAHTSSPAMIRAVATEPIRGALHYPDLARDFLEPYLPGKEPTSSSKPYVTLTWATSLDARIALRPGVQTALSGPETKAMTHYLRSRHDAILIGVTTAIADDPSLNCRLAGAGGFGGHGQHQQPRPIIVDPHGRLQIRPDMKVLQVAAEGRAKGPWVIVTTAAQLQPNAVQTLKRHGGEYLMINDTDEKTGHLNWEAIFGILHREGIKSVMIEGGGTVLSDLLNPYYGNCINSVILTIAPTFFGKAGVEVSPTPTLDQHGQPFQHRLTNVRWQPMGDADVVMCAHMQNSRPKNSVLQGIQDFS